MASTETGATLALSGLSREEVRRGRDSAEAGDGTLGDRVRACLQTVMGYVRIPDPLWTF